MERQKYDDTIRRDTIALARAAMNEAAADVKPAISQPLIPAERVTSTGRVIETQTTGAAPSPAQPE